MAILSIVFVVCIQAAVILALFGWITPLGIGLVLRRTPPPRPRPWLMTSAIWGGLSALIVAGMISISFIAFRNVGSRFGSNRGPAASAFEAEAYSGPTVALPVPEGMTVRMKLGPADGDEANVAWDVESDGTALAVPEGAMQMYSLSFSMKDASGVEWKLGSDWDEPAPFTPGRDTPPWMGRLRAGMEVTSSPLTDDLRASLQFADEAGRPYELDAPCGRADRAQQLAMFNAQGEEVWSGRFSFG
jgi:hypothetical protein